jgi:hypothetical protein
MTSLSTVLQKYAEPGRELTVQLGSDETHEEETPEKETTKGPTVDREALRKDLKALKQDNNRYFVVCVVMVILLFVVCVVVILMNLKDAGIVKLAMSAFGVSAAGLITVMTNLWRVKSNTEVLILLAVNTDSDTVKTVINVLAKRL